MAQINKSSEYFNTVLWTGDGTSGRTISGVGFQSDFLWIKSRNNATNHSLTDVIRGGDLQLRSNTTDAESQFGSQDITFTSDGFTNAGSTSNNSGFTFVGWNWLAGGTASSNTDGDITSQVSANTTSGFSIVSYTGNGSNGASFGHGLGVKPKIVLIKNRTTAKNWVYWQDTTNNGTSDVRLCLNLTNANFNNFHVTFGTSTITLGDTDDAWNKSGDNLIAYCFSEKKGFSKFGSYIGNGSTDGTFIYTGFKPAFVIAKESSEARDWQLWDNKRLGYNASGGNKNLTPNTTAVEDTYADIDILSNGFKLKSTSAAHNKSGQTYIYMAFAENPLVGTNNIPATAR